MFILCFSILIASTIYLAVKLISSKNAFPTVIAGDVDGNVLNKPKYSKLTVFVDRKKFKLFTPSKNTFIGIVGGKSMEPRGLNLGDTIIGYKFKRENLDQLKEGDILIIYISDQNKENYGMVKLRVFGKVNNSEEILTYKYIDGKEVPSGPHKIEDIRAIVKRKIINKAA